jgi:hypothetical protein
MRLDGPQSHRETSLIRFKETKQILDGWEKDWLVISGLGDRNKAGKQPERQNSFGGLICMESIRLVL